MDTSGNMRWMSWIYSTQPTMVNILKLSRNITSTVKPVEAGIQISDKTQSWRTIIFDVLVHHNSL